MKVRKGMVNNPNGRPKGSVNKATAKAKELINAVMVDRYQDFLDAFDELEGKYKVDVFIKLFDFILPRKQSISAEIESNVQISKVDLKEYEKIKKELKLK